MANHKQVSIPGMHASARAYSSEFRANESASSRWSALRQTCSRVGARILHGSASFYVPIAILFVGIAWVLLAVWDQEAFKESADEALRAAVERSEFRPYFATDKHCRVPYKDEVLVMQLAKPGDAGSGFKCRYFTNMGFGRAPKYTAPYYSRGMKEAS